MTGLITYRDFHDSRELMSQLENEVCCVCVKRHKVVKNCCLFNDLPSLTDLIVLRFTPMIHPTLWSLLSLLASVIAPLCVLVLTNTHKRSSIFCCWKWLTWIRSSPPCKHTQSWSSRLVWCSGSHLQYVLAVLFPRVLKSVIISIVLLTFESSILYPCSPILPGTSTM